MLLAIDIGNTDATIGFFQEKSFAPSIPNSVFDGRKSGLF